MRMTLTEKIMHAYMKKRYEQNLLESFFDPQTKTSVTLLLKSHWKNDLNKQLW